MHDRGFGTEGDLTLALALVKERKLWSCFSKNHSPKNYATEFLGDVLRFEMYGVRKLPFSPGSPFCPFRLPEI